MTGSRAVLASFLVLLVLGVFGLTAALSHHDAASSTASADRPPAEVVTMDNQLNFAPDTVRVQVGETVEWRNTSLLVHTVTADPDTAARAEHVEIPDGAEPFHSGNMDPETSWSRTFEVSGTYRYFCIPHEAAGMLGTISGTMVMGLAPIFILSFLPGAGRASFHLAFWPGLLIGVVKVVEGATGAPIFPGWLDLGVGTYADDLGVNVYGLLVCTAGYLLGTVPFTRS